MASSESLPVFELRADDIDAGLALSREANWNQVRDDWLVFIRHGKIFGSRDGNGQLIACAAALPYPSGFGYVAMVLVTRKWRRQGLATRLVDRCIGWLRERRLVPMLDATKAGAEVYRRQGFEPLFELDRWQLGALPDSNVAGDSAGGAAGTPEPGIDLPELARLDAEAVGVPRAVLINDFAARAGTNVFVAPDGSGFAMIRRGRRACQIGPVVARSQADAVCLLATATDSTGETIFVDVPVMATQVGAWLKNRGFGIQRSFLRMALGHGQPFGATDRLIASAGPEFG